MDQQGKSRTLKRWQVTLCDLEGTEKVFKGFPTVAEADQFANKQVNGNTRWATYFGPPVPYDADPGD